MASATPHGISVHWALSAGACGVRIGINRLLIDSAYRTWPVLDKLHSSCPLGEQSPNTLREPQEAHFNSSFPYSCQDTDRPFQAEAGFEEPSGKRWHERGGWGRDLPFRPSTSATS